MNKLQMSRHSRSSRRLLTRWQLRWGKGVLMKIVGEGEHEPVIKPRPHRYSTRPASVVFLGAVLHEEVNYILPMLRPSEVQLSADTPLVDVSAVGD
jgi:hypothetical protein